jgi:capsular polysaccharide biosynthesis protein
LPRLAFLGERRDLTLVVSDQDAAFRRDSLALCGFPAARIVQVADFHAVAADTLLVPFDTRSMPHPAHKAAFWALDFLRARIGFAALATSRPGPRKLYVSRADAGGRRVLNEDAMMRLLAPLGYELATLSGRSLADQVALFAGATHIVGLHGAGLANIVFAPAGGRLLELFPASYGMPSYYVLAAGQGLGYATYIAHDVRAGSRTQVDDVVIDVADFSACCRDLL